MGILTTQNIRLQKRGSILTKDSFAQSPPSHVSFETNLSKITAEALAKEGFVNFFTPGEIRVLFRGVRGSLPEKYRLYDGYNRYRLTIPNNKHSKMLFLGVTCKNGKIRELEFTNEVNKLNSILQIFDITINSKDGRVSQEITVTGTCGIPVKSDIAEKGALQLQELIRAFCNNPGNSIGYTEE